MKTLEEKRASQREYNRRWIAKPGNREKRLAAYHRWYEKNGKKYNCESKHRINLKHKYGLTFEEFDEKLIEQNFVCAICGCAETAINNNANSVKRLSVDHNHSTGKVRGLLCSRCNSGLGLFQESPELLEAATKYIRGYQNV